MSDLSKKIINELVSRGMIHAKNKHESIIIINELKREILNSNEERLLNILSSIGKDGMTAKVLLSKTRWMKTSEREFFISEYVNSGKIKIKMVRITQRPTTVYFKGEGEMIKDNLLS